MGDLFAKAKAALALIAQGREAIAAITDSIKDGTAALSTTELDDLNELLANEQTESRVAHDNLRDAINDARS